MSTSDLNKYRAVFISDVHLGSIHSKPERLLAFLRQATASQIYIIGDFLDNHIYLRNWPKAHNEVLSLLADMGLRGTQVTYIPGNHDAIFRHHLGKYGNLNIVARCVYHALNGKRYLVTHGDETDMFGIGKLLIVLAFIERFTPISLWEVLRKLFGLTIKRHAAKFEAKMLATATDYDGVICGHVHYPHVTSAYMNTGDWVQHCTSVVEHHDGSFELLQG